MRHAKKHKQMGRTAAHREATLRNMSISLIQHKRIITTHAKAKVLRPYLEPIITRAKDNTQHSRRIVYSKLKNKEAVKELFGPVVVAIGDRPGGYLRIFGWGFGKGVGGKSQWLNLLVSIKLMIWKIVKTLAGRGLEEE